MKNIIRFCISLLWLVLFVSCEEETIIPVKADFSIEVVNDDYTAPVKVKITNKSKGADYYEWYFDGATVGKSIKINPKPIIYKNAGTYTILLKASNKDGSSGQKSIDIKIDKAMKIDFSWQKEGSDFAPLTLKMINKSIGANKYSWTFQNGSPSSSKEKAPKVTFLKEGKHLIQLTISNGKETHSIEKTIEVKPGMTVDFDWKVNFIDKDYRAPITLILNNKSKNATSFKWEIEGAEPFDNTQKNPKVLLKLPKKYKIILNAKNDKEEKTLTKTVTVLQGNNLLSFKDVKLGINTAHKSLGAFFSSTQGKVITEKDVAEDNGMNIDFIYFGLNSNFTYNQILSPDEVQNTTFNTIKNAQHTKIISNQKLVQKLLTPSQFDELVHGDEFININFEETKQSNIPFDKQKTPMVILFETKKGRKGAIKIKEFKSLGKNSYILVDIKVQKNTNS